MEGAPGTLYEGEKFQLLFKFSSRYPFDSPQVSTKNSGPVFTSFVFNIVIKDMKGRSAAQIVCSAVVQWMTLTLVTVDFFQISHRSLV